MRYLLTFLAFVMIVAVGVFYPQHTQADKAPPAPVATSTPVQITHRVIHKTLAKTQDEWINDLELCESGGYDHAINPKDLDGTASLGPFQFKVTTFEWLLIKYNIPSAPIFSEPTQRAIVGRMINDPSINLLNQFPDCIMNHIGFPPKAG